MSKERYLKARKKPAIIVNIASGIILLLMLFIIVKGIMPPFTQSVAGTLGKGMYWLLIIIVLFGSLATLIVSADVLITAKHEEYIAKKYYEENLRKIQNLSNEFSEVQLKDFEYSVVSGFIPYRDLNCVAKLDEENNIIYKIQIDIQIRTNDYDLFLEHFDIQHMPNKELI